HGRCAGVLEDIAGLVLGVVPVDGDRVRAECPDSHAGLEEREIVAQDQRYGVSGPDPQVLEARRRLRDPSRQLDRVELTRSARDRSHRRLLTQTVGTDKSSDYMM